MDKYIKRLQTRANRKGISVSKSQVREIYTQVVAEPESPSDEEMSAVIQQLEAQFQAPSYEVVDSQLTVTEQTEQPGLTQAEEPQKMTQPTSTQPAQELPEGALTTSTHSGITQTSSPNLSITQQQIQEAVEQQFGRENIQTKTAILNYVAQDTFSTAQELQSALSKLRQMKADLLMKLISDYNQASGDDENLLKSALLVAASSRKSENDDFFGSFWSHVGEKMAEFGI